MTVGLNSFMFTLRISVELRTVCRLVHSDWTSGFCRRISGAEEWQFNLSQYGVECARPSIWFATYCRWL